MGGFNAIDLSTLPAPSVVVEPDFEALVLERRADIVARYRLIEPDATLGDALAATLALESEPIAKLVESGAYREVLHYARVNAAARSVMVAFATGSDLDQLAALHGVERQIATPATDDAPAVMESDARLRLRITLAPEAWEGAGTAAAIVFHAMAADARVAHVGLSRVRYTGEITVAILSAEGDGTASEELLTAVRSRLTADDVKLMTDVISVRAAGILPYSVAAHLKVGTGVAPALVAAQAEKQIRAMAAERHRIGRKVPLSAIDAAAHVTGVEESVRSAPMADITPDASTAPWLEAVTITTEVVDV